MGFQVHWWQGASGAWFPHTVFPFTDQLPFDDIHYMLAKRNWDGTCTAIYNGETQDGSRRFPNHEKFQSARRQGANEIHVYFESSKAVRLRIETDIRHGHPTWLNKQSIPAPPPAPRHSPSALSALGATDYVSELLSLVSPQPAPAPTPFTNGLLGLLNPDPPAPSVASALRALANPPSPFDNPLARALGAYR